MITSERADRVVDQNPIPDKLIENIEDEMRRARIRVGAMLADMLADKIQHRNEFGNHPTHIVVSNDLGGALAEWARYQDVSGQFNGEAGVLVTLWGMKVVHTTRPNALEVY